MHSGHCHCGAIRIEIQELAPELIDCNCSICRRYGALWALYDAGRVRVAGHPEHTQSYVWGKQTIATFRCRHCGCVTHWESLPSDSVRRVGVNTRMFDSDVHAALAIRRFDGADTWTYLE